MPVEVPGLADRKPGVGSPASVTGIRWRETSRHRSTGQGRLGRRDDRTRLRVLEIYPEADQTTAVVFLDHVCERCRPMHGPPATGVHLRSPGPGVTPSRRPMSWGFSIESRCRDASPVRRYERVEREPTRNRSLLRLGLGVADESARLRATAPALGGACTHIRSAPEARSRDRRSPPSGTGPAAARSAVCSPCRRGQYCAPTGGAASGVSGPPRPDPRRPAFDRTRSQHQRNELMEAGQYR